MKNNKKNWRIVLLRNLLILLAVFAASVALTERILSKGNPALTSFTEEEYEAQDEENGMIMLMQTEQMPVADLLSGLDADSDFAQCVLDALPSEERSEAEQARESRYPLISLMQRQQDYDEDAFHIVVLGDSFTFGQSVTNRNEVFWRLVETDLRAQGYNVRVSGVAMLAANAYDELFWLTDSSLISDLNPDMIVFAYLYNDPEYDGAEEAVPGGPNFVQIDKKYRPALDLLSRFLPNISARLRYYIISKTMYQAEGSYVGYDGVISAVISAPILKGHFLEKFKNEFIAPLDAFAARQDIPVVLMPLAVDSGKTMLKELYRPLHTLCAEYGNIRLYDSTHDFFHGFASSAHARNYRINIADLHPGSAMNYYYAQFMERFLKKDFAQELGAPAGKDLNTAEPTINEALPFDSVISYTAGNGEAAEYEIVYPPVNRTTQIHGIEARRYLFLPIGKDHISLSFAVPAALDEIRIAGDGAEKIELYYRRINEKLGYDDHTLYTPEKNGDAWRFPAEDRVTTLMIHADCKNDDGALLNMTIR